MKKLLAMLLALGVMMSLAACGEQKDNTDTPDDADAPSKITYAVEAGSAGEEVALPTASRPCLSALRPMH